MPERNELIIAELLARHGRLYAQDAGIRLADRPGPLTSCSCWRRC